MTETQSPSYPQAESPVTFNGTYDDLNRAHQDGTEDSLYPPEQVKKDNAEAYKKQLDEVDSFGDLGRLTSNVQEGYDTHVGDSSKRRELTQAIGETAKIISIKQRIEGDDPGQKQQALLEIDQYLLKSSISRTNKAQETGLFTLVRDRILANDPDVIKATLGRLSDELNSYETDPAADVAVEVFVDAIRNPRQPENGAPLNGEVVKLRERALQAADRQLLRSKPANEVQAQRQKDFLSAVRDRILANDPDVIKATLGRLSDELNSYETDPAAEMYAGVVIMVNEGTANVPEITEKLRGSRGSELVQKAYQVASRKKS